MIKSGFVQRLSLQNPHLYQRDVENIVNAILDELVAAMARGDRVELRGFGAFSVKNRPARSGRNPRTGALVSVEKKSVPSFRTGKEMRARAERPERVMPPPRSRSPLTPRSDHSTAVGGGRVAERAGPHRVDRDLMGDPPGGR